MTDSGQEKRRLEALSRGSGAGFLWRWLGRRWGCFSGWVMTTGRGRSMPFQRLHRQLGRAVASLWNRRLASPPRSVHRHDADCRRAGAGGLPDSAITRRSWRAFSCAVEWASMSIFLGILGVLVIVFGVVLILTSRLERRISRAVEPKVFVDSMGYRPESHARFADC